MEATLLRDLLLHFTLSKSTTSPIDYGAPARATSRAIQRLYPFDEDGAVVSDYAVLPLLALGDVDGNGLFGRISADAADPSILYVAFRPLNIEGIDTIVQNAKLRDVFLKYFRMRKVAPGPGYTANNLIHLVHMIDGKKVHASGILDAYVAELERPAYNLYIENNLAAMTGTKTARNTSKKSKYAPHITGLATADKAVLADDPAEPLDTTSIGKKTKTGAAILDTLVRFIESYKPSQVHFVGFSLGSGLALATATLVHRALAAAAPLPSFHVYQFAGPKVGTSAVQAYADAHFAKCYYVGVSKDGYLDLVSRLQDRPLVHVAHAGQAVDIDLLRHTIAPLPAPPAARKAMSMTRLVVGFITKQPSAAPFNQIHNAAETVIPRVLYKHAIERDVNLKPYVRDGPTCEYFEQGFAGKYDTCPTDVCLITPKIVNNKALNACVQKPEPVVAPRATKATKAKATATKTVTTKDKALPPRVYPKLNLPPIREARPMVSPPAG